MCEIYVKADPILYESRSRSLRIHGAVTKIRLENLFWDILAELAESDGYTTNQLIAKLEGLVRHDGRWLASVDADDPDRASDLLELVLDGPAPRP